MDNTPSSSSAKPNRPGKCKKLPPIGHKINRITNPEKEKDDVHKILLKQKEFLQEQRIEKNHLLVDAEWNPDINEAMVTKNSGSSLEVFGYSRNRCTFLYPEEALYLIEMNKLQLFYNSVRMSVQRSYCILLHPSTNVTVDQYRIFKHFVVHGYKLFRHDKNKDSKMHVPSSYKNELESDSPYGKYFENLRIFNTPAENVDTPVLEITYDVHVPNSVIRKSCRPDADYFLTVLKSDEDIFNLFQLVSTNSANLLFASVIGNAISVFNLHGVQIPNLF